MAKEKKINTKEVIIVTITLTLICLITTALLAIINSVTKDPIAQNLAKAEDKARKMVVAGVVDPSATTEAQIDSIVISFEEAEVEIEVEGNLEKRTLHKAFDENGSLIGYAVSTSAKGYGGDVSVMTGFGVDGKILKVVVVAADDETPGLGANIKKDSFLDLFKGKSGELKLVTAGQKTGADNEIDAISSATYSSVAVVDAVNEANTIVNKVLGGDGQ